MSGLQLFDALPAHIEAALRDSIEEFGVLLPIFVTQHGEVIDGHHRSRIANDLGVEFETVVMEVKDEEHALRLAHTLNSDRRQLSTQDRLKAAARLRERGHSYRAIGEALGVSHEQARKDATSAVNGLTPQQPAEVRGVDGKTYPAKVTERRSESTTVEQGGLVEEQQASPQVEEWIDTGRDVQDAKYLHEFAKALTRAHDYRRFDSERIGHIADESVVTSIQVHLDGAQEFLDQVKRARSGLRVVNGGRP